MKNQLLSLSRNVFKALSHFDNLLSQVNVVLLELREIKELIRIQNEQGRDTQLLSSDEVADKLQVTARTLRAWKKDGKLVPIKLGARSYYRISDVVKYGLLIRESAKGNQ